MLVQCSWTTCALAVHGEVGVTDDLDRGADRARLLEQGLGLVRVVLQAAAALQVPGIARWVGLVEHGALPVIHRLMNGVAVDGVRRRGAQALVLKLARARKLKAIKLPPWVPIPTVILVAEALFEALDIGLGHGVDEVYLAGAQRRQAAPSPRA